MVRDLLPNFFIVGAAKCGTSSLDQYLSQHPEIYIPPKKEAHYFSIDSFPRTFTGPGDEGMNLYTIRKKNLYAQLFEVSETYRAVGESSVFYLYYPGTAKRIYAEIPDAKIIILLRNPVDRAFSAYMHLIRDEREDLTFEQGLNREEYRKNLDYEPMWLYKELGMYSQQVRQYLEVFGRSQVKVVIFEEFIRDKQAVLVDVLNFLNVNSKFPIDTSLQFNESGKPKARWLYNFVSKPNPLKELVKPFISDAVRERLGIRAKSMLLEKASMAHETREGLEDLFEEDISALESLLRRDLSIWRNPQQTYHLSTDVG